MILFLSNLCNQFMERCLQMHMAFLPKPSLIKDLLDLVVLGMTDLIQMPFTVNVYYCVPFT